MNELLRQVGRALEGAGSGSKAVAGMVGLALVLVVAATAVVSSRPHFELAFSGLSDHEVAKVNKALSEAGIAFEVSQPPAPFSVYVDDSERSNAYSAVYGAGALDKPLGGILSESGVASVFQGSEERLQSVRKREWQEMEGMLEVLDFVVSARVRTSPGSTSPFAGADAPPTSASVTLRLAEGGHLEPEQAETVANLVSRGLGVDEEDLVISDQSGNRLWNGAADEGLDGRVQDFLAHRERHDRRATEEANAVLTEILGPDKARVTVRSEWDYDQSTTRTESASGKGSLVSEQTSSSETPVTGDEPRVGGPAGIDASLADGTAEDAGAAEQEADAGELPVAKTSEERKEYRPAVTTEERVSFVPELSRLSVAVFLDESIDTELSQRLEETIKAAVGFVERRDEFRSVSVPFAGAGAGESPDGGGPAAQELPEGDSLVQTLIERGVEIVLVLVFVVLLLKSLKGAGRTRAPREREPEPELDPELLARAKVEELLRAEPERVGEILSSWARAEERQHAGGART